MSQYERVADPASRAEELLAGPRGRELCARLAGIAVRDTHDPLALPVTARFFPLTDPARTGPLAEAESLNQRDEERPAAEPAAEFDPDDQLAVIPALAGVVEEAGYWGGSAADPLDDPAAIAGLRGMAVRLAESAGCQWWWSGLDRAAQRHVQWTAREGPPGFGDAAEMLRRADVEAGDDERRMGRYRHLAAGTGVSGAPSPGRRDNCHCQ